jgi:hypothetical protein
MLSNGALIIAIQNANGLHTDEAEQSEKTATYFAIVLWVTAGLSAVRFVGCVYFWYILFSLSCPRLFVGTDTNERRRCAMMMKRCCRKS